jgi:hypothetical protein
MTFENRIRQMNESKKTSHTIDTAVKKVTVIMYRTYVIHFFVRFCTKLNLISCSYAHFYQVFQMSLYKRKHYVKQ